MKSYLIKVGFLYFINNMSFFRGESRIVGNCLYFCSTNVCLARSPEGCIVSKIYGRKAALTSKA